MAGAVAMASVIEDFVTPPSKKQRKDVEGSSVKPITNYFLPMPKSTEKPFSPPRSNNIKDYFTRTLSSAEKSVVSKQSKANSQKDTEGQSHTETVAQTKPQSLGRGRRSRKPLHFSKGDYCTESSLEGIAVMVPDSSCASNAITPSCDAGRGSVILGSETAVLLAQISAEAFGEHDNSPGVNVPCAHHKKSPQDRSKRRGSVKCKTKAGVSSSAQVSCLESPGESGKKSRDGAEPGRGLTSPERCDSGAELSVDETSKLNDSTVTISFEDFLESQKLEEDPVSVDASENRSEVLCTATAAHGDSSTSQKVSPRTLTIHAEVHTISQPPELVRNTRRRLASIFTRRSEKELASNKVEVSSCPLEKLDSPPAPQWKSNVVLLEEDLELAVIEPGATSKCSQAERKQFMSAFRQPNLEAGKSKPKKGPCKPDALWDQSPTLGEGEEVSDSLGDAKAEDDEMSTTQPLKGDKAGRKHPLKLRRGSKKKAGEASLQDAPPEDKLALGTDGKSVQPDAGRDGDATPTGGRMTRRSCCSRRQEEASKQSLETQSPLTRSRERLKNQHVSKASTQESPVPVFTPKARKSKCCAYRAEMLSPPDDKESPIRMRFRRVFLESDPKSGDASDFEILSPLATNAGTSKSRKQAKKLLQRAKVLQQNKNKITADDKGIIRRSLRHQSFKKPSYYEDEDSVLCLEEKPDNLMTKENAKGRKQLRSLNEVLGKTALTKVARSCTVSKVGPVFLGKKMPRPSPVISIFDDLGQEGSENSQDDEQFRARREFLKSGLPDSFKKQMARTVATQDAYSASCSSFQHVVHVLQRPMDCPIWNLPWPGSSLLKHLEKCSLEPLKPALSLGRFDFAKILPAPRLCVDKGTGWREDLSEQVCKCLLEEVRASNPQFPVQRFFTSFVKRRTEHLQLCAAPEPDGVGSGAPASPTGSAGRKQKRRSEDKGRPGGAKRRRSSRGEPVVISDSPPGGDDSCGPPLQTSGRSRRTWRQGPQDGVDPGVAVHTPVQNQPIIVLDDTPPGMSERAGCTKEDVLWTEKYQPQHSSEVMGNSCAVRRLHSWLREWKLRADREERRNQQMKKREDHSNESWDCGDFQGEEEDTGEEQLCNTLLITGPPGVGKTAAVYACAQELGFKVFEVNASSQRSGRQILSQLKEATQSHQVGVQGGNALKPSYFSSCSAVPGSSPKKGGSPRKVVSSPRKAPQSPHSASSRKGALAPASLASYFKMGRWKDKTQGTRADRPVNDRCPRKAGHAEECSSKPAVDRRESAAEEQSRRMATSLILFEEVDVIFDEDSGFLAAIKTFMTTTKRPVILTTTDSTFSKTFDGNFEEIQFKTPSVVNVGSYLQLVCLAENVRVDAEDLSSLLALTGGDVRQSLLLLQFWVRSGGGRCSSRPLLAPACPGSAKPGLSVNVEGPDKEKEQVSHLPPCDTGCTASLLGLLNIESVLDLKELCKCKPFTEACWDLLTDAWRRGVDLLYSNMEELLPLPVSDLQTRSLRTQEVLDTKLHKEPVSQESHLQSNDSPVKVSSAMRRRRGRFAQTAVIQSDSDSQDSFLSLCKPLEANVSKPEETAVRLEAERGERSSRPALPLRCRRRAECSPAKQRATALVSSCLETMAEFLDHMSFLDSSLHEQNTQVEGSPQQATLSWTGSGVKSGLTDEPREELSALAGAGQKSGAEMRAAVEGLSFQRCQAGIAQAWTESQLLEQEMREKVASRLSLPVAPHRRRFSLCHTSFCEPRKAERQSGLLRTLSARVLGLPTNKSAAATEYVPTLRTICRSERLKEQGRVKRRFLHYLDGIHLSLSKNILQQLAEEFP